MTDFDYEKAARDRGWDPRTSPQWSGIRWVHGGHGYEGTARELCFLIGVGPEFEAWAAARYRKPVEK